MKVVLIDNFDSFVYNLAQYIGSLGAEPEVVRNTASVASIEASEPDAIVISPGPGQPEDAGCSVEVVTKLGASIPILGVCLGHQAIGVAYGAKVVRAPELMHGKTSTITHDEGGVFRGLPNPFHATRYHSLAIEPGSIPSSLRVSASAGNVVMGVRHESDRVEGVQFHPESVLTECGLQLVENFLEGARG